MALDGDWVNAVDGLERIRPLRNSVLERIERCGYLDGALVFGNNHSLFACEEDLEELLCVAKCEQRVLEE